MASAMPRKKRQVIRLAQSCTVAWMVATKPQKKTTTAAQRWGGNCFQPMMVHWKRISVTEEGVC